MSDVQDYQGRLATAEGSLLIAEEHRASSQERLAVVEACLAVSEGDAVNLERQLAVSEGSLAGTKALLQDTLDRCAHLSESLTAS